MAFVRCFCRILSILVFVCCPMLLSSQQSDEQPTEVTICALQTTPQNWNHKLIRVSGYVTHGYEESSLVDPKCYGYAQGTPVWMEYGGMASTGTTYFGGGANTRRRAKSLSIEGISTSLIEDANFKHLDGLLQSHPYTRQVTVVPVTVQGHFFSGVDHKAEYGRGYGHFGCCTLFVVEKVDRTAERALSTKETQKFAEAFHLPPPLPPAPTTHKQ